MSTSWVGSRDEAIPCSYYQSNNKFITNTAGGIGSLGGIKFRTFGKKISFEVTQIYGVALALSDEIIHFLTTSFFAPPPPLFETVRRTKNGIRNDITL